MERLGRLELGHVAVSTDETPPPTTSELMNPARGSLDIYAISKAVNNVRANGPKLLDPLKV
jgi:putative SOS response-associated peptidase YedK